ncbi:MAG TPA: RNA methyltransferase, partial [Acidobacteriota bacterium]|nr:RNA methyltransferase [Acidobacteriota bacterium]
IPLMLIADRIRDPGNLGVLIRTAAAAGASAVVTLAGSVSARNSKAVRSSAGAFFRVPVIEHVAAGKLLDFCRSRSIRLYRADARGGIRYTEADLRTSCAVLLGSETGGISEKDFAGVTSITVPMAHDAESLNVAMAGSVIFFEAFRQRHHLRQPCLL